MGQTIVEMHELTKKYDELTAVDRLTLTIEKGEIFGLLGPNGAGKSTTILMMLGLTEPTAGKVHVCGVNSTREPLKVKEKVGYLPDDVGFYEDLTGFENLVYTAQLNKIPPVQAREKALALLRRVGLEEAVHKKAGKYSRGMRQRLGLADVLIKEPEVVILDEPTLGIDPEGVREFLDMIQRLSWEEGMTVLLSSHHLHQVQQICDRVGLFVRGRLIAEGNIHDLARELFSREAVIVTIEAESLTNEAIQALQTMEAVESIEHEEDKRRLIVRCTADITGEISRTLIEKGALITHLRKKDYGLDEIYHRYFEGGEAREEYGDQLA